MINLIKASRDHKSIASMPTVTCAQSTPVLRVETAGPVAFVRINRPEAMNALDIRVREELGHAIERIANDASVRVGVLTGEGGRAFCAGIDLREADRDLTADRRPKVVPDPSRLSTPFRELYECDKPFIAAIDGYCLAGGLELALMCDIRIATVQSTFGMPEARRSLMGGVALLHLRRVVPLGEALRLHLTGSSISAAHAHRIGLVQDLAADREQLFTRAGEVAEEIAACAPLALAAIKKVLRAGSELPPQDTWRMVSDLQEELTHTEDFREGVAAFAEKRRPSWRAR